MTWILIGAGYGLVFYFALSLACVASQADDAMERALRRRRQELASHATPKRSERS